MSTLNASEKIAIAQTQINNLIERYRNSDTASLKKQEITQIFESILLVIDTNKDQNKEQVKQFLFQYLRLLNKVLCTSTDILRVHIELENQISYLRNFVTDELNSLK